MLERLIMEFVYSVDGDISKAIHVCVIHLGKLMLGRSIYALFI